MNRKLNLLLILLFLSAQTIFSQTVEKEKKDEISAELKKEAVAFLRETGAEVGNLRTLENRISFSAEIASLMWFHDEKEARAMFQSVINDFRQLLVQYNTQLGTTDITPESGSIFSPDTSEKGQLSRKFRKAISVRQQIAMTIAEHDPRVALEFFTDTAAAITNPAFRKQIESGDTYFETRLLNRIAAKDVDTALKYGRKALAKGFNGELISLLKKIYDKDAEKGIAFGEDILQKLKSEDSTPDKFYYLSSLLSLGVSNLEEIKAKPDKKPLFKEQSLRELADLLAQAILKRGDAEGSDMTSYIANIERFAPARAAQIRQKFGVKNVKNDGGVKVVRNGTGEIITEIATPIGKPDQDAQKQLVEDVAKLGTLSKEEREKIVGSARKIIAAIKDPTQKLFALSALAAQVAVAGDKELASQIMDEARAFVNLSPKNYQDFMHTWLLAGGYAHVDAVKSFPLLEDAIFRLNDTIAAFAKVGEFIDVGGDIIEDGEIQVGSFGGSLTQELTRNLGQADTTIRRLAIADFARTRALTNKFDRLEARILAKMLVLRAVLEDRKLKDESEV